MTHSEQTLDATIDTPPVGETGASHVAYGNWLFASLPPRLVGGLSDEQRDAIHAALTAPAGVRPPVNIRLSIPFFHRRYFLAVIGGAEKRGAARRAHERRHHPLRTMANVFFVLGLATLFYILAVFAMALQSAIFEF